MFKINVVAGTKAYCNFRSCIVDLNVSQGLLCNSFEIGFIHGQAQSISEKCMSNFNYNISLFMFSGISVPTVCWTISNFMASFKKNNRCCTACIVLNLYSLYGNNMWKNCVSSFFIDNDICYRPYYF